MRGVATNASAGAEDKELATIGRAVLAPEATANGPVEFGAIPRLMLEANLCRAFGGLKIFGGKGHLSPSS